MRWWHNVKSISENYRTKRRMIRNAQPLNKPLNSLTRGFYQLETQRWGTTDPEEGFKNRRALCWSVLHCGEWKRSPSIKRLRMRLNFTWMRVSLCQFHQGVFWAKNIFICVSGLWPRRPVWEKRSRPPLRSPILLSTRVTCQLMWPSWDVNRSGKNQMFSFTSGASTLFFSRRWQANMSRYWPGTQGLWEGSCTQSLGSENIKILPSARRKAVQTSALDKAAALKVKITK